MAMISGTKGWTKGLVVALLVALPTVAFGFQTKAPAAGALDSATLIDSKLAVTAQPVDLASAIKAGLPSSVASAWQAFGAAAGKQSWDAYVDQLSGLPALVQGSGVSMLTPGKATLADADGAFRGFLLRNAGLLNGVAPKTLELNTTASSVDEDGRISLLYNWKINDVPVEGAYFVARFVQGRLVQFGAQGIGPVRNAVTTPSISADAARETVLAYAGGFDERTDSIVDAGSLHLVPMAQKGTAFSGDQLTTRLLFSVSFRRQGMNGTWQGRVDAIDGTVVEFRDTNDYGVVKGGVYPGTATGKGTEIDIPLAFANYGTSSYADGSGIFSGTSGTSSLAGKYMKMVDSCGSISLAANSSGAIDFGTSSGTDCTTPGTGGAGNTHASRSGYFWLTAINRKAATYLPTNSWLGSTVTSNMNLNQTCNAYWNGSSVNFFKSGGGCGNTGELPGVFLHEWGHGLDSNDGTTPDGGSGEAMGDVMAMTMTHVSCTGGGFLSSNCSSYGDACLNCTGVRDADYHKHSGNAPWTYSTVSTKCPSGSGTWGKEVHCESLPAAQAMWDLSQSLVTKYGDAGWLVFDKLWYKTRPTSAGAYTKTATSGQYGCTSTNWYPALLAADDDDGNLSNGTPNANEIYNAFSAHTLACTTQVHTSTVTGAGLGTPAVTGNGTGGTGSLTWSAISGASSYVIYRNSLGATYGYTQIGTTTSASYNDTAVFSGMTYYYAVQAVGSVSSNISQLGKATVTIGGSVPTTYSISGNAGTSGAVVSTSAGSATADSAGAYTINGLANGTYTVTPSKTGCTFTPASSSVTINNGNMTANFTASCTSTDIPLTSGVAKTGQSVAQGAWLYYYIDVPSGATNLTMATTSATGDVDIYTQFNTKPTSSAYTCRPYTSSGNESCSATNPSAGRWYLGVYGYAAGTFTVTATITSGTPTTYSIAGSAGTASATVSAGTATATADASGNYTIANLAAGTYTVTASKSGCTFSPASISVTVGPNATGKNFTATCGTGDTALTNGVALNSQTVAVSAWKYYYISVPTGATNLTLATTNATGDVDIYTQFNAKPTSSTYVCRPYTSSGNESCSATNPSAGTWWIGVYGYAAATFSVTGTYTTGGGGGTVTERLTNGGYESITASGNTTPDGSWTGVINSGTSINTMTAAGSYPHSGTDYAYMGVNASTSQQTLTSAATTAIPSTATQATLSFYVSIVTSETGTTAYDTLKVNLLSSTGTVLATLGTLSNANSTGGAGTYVQKSYNILSYKGQAVKVQFVANTDSSLATTFRIDDVSVKSD